MVSVWLAAAAFLFGGVVGFALMAIIAIGKVSEADFGRDKLELVPEALPEPATPPRQLTFISANGQKRPRLLTARQAAKRVGMSERWLYDNQRTLPFTVRLGSRSVRFDSELLAEWLKDRKAARR